MDVSHRKATVKLHFTDRTGKPVAGRQVKAEQRSHSFLFGCGGFVFAPYLAKQTPELKNLADLWLDVFNYATLPFYWGMFEPVEGEPHTEELMRTALFLKERGVRVKGHPLCWHTVCADWLMKYDNTTILEKQLGRIDREVTGFKGVIDMWDVINEVVIMPVFDKYDNAVTRLCKEYGRVDLVKKVFDEAKRCNPGATLLLNDFNTSEHYAELIEQCLDAGIPISAIGIQSHQHQGYWGPEKLEEVLERFSRFGLPLHFTENTLISGELMPPHIEDLNDWVVEEWPSTPEGEERQCREVEEMYRILFSHPLVEAITTWDFTDGAWLKAPSGFVRLDGTPKPSYHMLKKLIREEWHTEETLTTDENGVATLEGFKGTYAFCAGGASGSADLSENGEITVVLD
ncbi:MAG: endo-1,4-beta-xylanase [Lachnospiraceae bacterium]|nr:endo-1,4-beta-xylanase [Lachnospiraceae bacterium]